MLLARAVLSEYQHEYIEAVRERQYGIMPVYTPLFEKEGA